jgi:hypothetical protein
MVRGCRPVTFLRSRTAQCTSRKVKVCDSAVSDFGKVCVSPPCDPRAIRCATQRPACAIREPCADPGPPCDAARSQRARAGLSGLESHRDRTKQERGPLEGL